MPVRLYLPWGRSYTFAGLVGHFPLGFGVLGSHVAGLAANFDLGPNQRIGSIIQTASFFERALIERFRHHPNELRLIDRRKFEELVAELFAGFGYEVELMRRTRDGGKDIVAIKRREADLKFLIQCKRPDPGNPVRVHAVRELHAVKDDDQASKAILATTTYFTPDARLFSERHRWELDLRDFDGIQAWIEEYLAGLHK